jgi:hypothetical protein
MTAPTATTELDAVNTLLEAIGADPVSSLSVSVDSDVTIARRIITETLREVQSQGWDFNTDLKYSMTRTVDNEYVIPSNMIAVDVSDDHPDVRATFRAGKLWDQTNHTFTWDKDLTFNVTWLFPFEELPEAARHYITMKAARKFQGRVLGSDNLGKYTEKDEMDAEAIFKDAEALDAEHNILTGNYDVYRVLDRRV